MNRPKTIHPLKGNLKARLNELTSTTYMLFLKTQNYHWHVTGPSFHSLHLLFESQYGELYQAIDTIAEHIRAMGEQAPATMKEFSTMSRTEEGTTDTYWEVMVQQLLEDHKIIITLLDESATIAESEKDQATLDLLAERSRAHQKHAWMLESLIS
jgi:starvation-inducible DNA-binding protein